LRRVAREVEQRVEERGEAAFKCPVNIMPSIPIYMGQKHCKEFALRIGN